MYNEFKSYVNDGLSIREIANKTGKSYSTVRFHLKKFNLTTRKQSKYGLTSLCKYCDRTFIYNRKSGHRWEICNTCGVAKRAKEMKQTLVNHLGGKCTKCGFSRTIEALQFHHLDSEEKDFIISGNYNRSIDALLIEVDKCVLLCANCHIEEHSKIGRFIDNS